VARSFTAPRSYWGASRAHRYSLIFALPLLVFYEILAALLSYQSGGVRNGADVLIKSAFIALAGPYGPALFGATVLGISVWVIHRDMRKHGRSLRRPVFGLMFVESVAYAPVFGTVVGGLTARLLAPFSLVQGGSLETLGWASRLMISLGAGIYEELLFRVILVSALAFAAQRIMGLRPWPAGVLATVLGAFVFSAFHYIGAYGDPLELGSFVYRMIGGLVFSAMYLLRGFGITAWTHALYDVFLLLIGW
jgi:hypothetical protein